jgi:hypothetical protein
MLSPSTAFASRAACSSAVVLPFSPALLTPAERMQLMANGEASLAYPDGFDPEPVVRLVSPSLALAWLLSEMDPLGTSDLAFGLLDQGHGCADLACVDLAELARRRGYRRDGRFRAVGPLSTYFAVARRPTHA